VRMIEPYSSDEYYTVVKGVLVRREGMSPEAAEEIARKLDGRSQDVRDKVRVARLAPQLGVEKAVKLLLSPWLPGVTPSLPQRVDNKTTP